MEELPFLVKMYNDDIFSCLRLCSPPLNSAVNVTFDFTPFRIGWNKEVTAKVGIPLMEGIQQAGD
jgi:hypothetical protein